MQTYSIIVVRSLETRQKLAVLAGDQQHIEQCDVFVGFMADIHRLEVVGQMHSLPLATSLDKSLVATVDPAFVGLAAVTA